jgi:DNA invertase Pin-like site-specific DNA recombinase
MVELTGRYSNHPDLVDHLSRIMAKLEQERGAGATPDGSLVVRTARRDARRLLVMARLRAEDVRALINSYHSGATIRDLAERFGLGTSSVKRLLRDNKARRKDQQRDTV